MLFMPVYKSFIYPCKPIVRLISIVYDATKINFSINKFDGIVYQENDCRQELSFP